MEQNAKGWLGNCSVTDSDNYPACRQAGITLERLAKRGYESMLDYYLKARPEQTFMGLSFTS
jgi:hypothetical protein